MVKLLARILSASRLAGRSTPESSGEEACRLRTSALLAHNSRPVAAEPARREAQSILPPATALDRAAGHQAAPAISGIRLPSDLDAYLVQQGNALEEIARFHDVLAMDHVVLELGCGGGEVAWQIASKNPRTGVIATDKYDLTAPVGEGSFYRKVAQAWTEGRLKVQETILDNLVLIRAEALLLRYLPPRSIDTVLLVNPEPSVGEAFVEAVAKEGWLDTLKPGNRKIVIKPFSREMSVMSCGGYEFDHSEDWSCGLGFIIGGALPFEKAGPVHWSVDLSSASPYCKNSTQHCVYICGDRTLRDTDAAFRAKRPFEGPSRKRSLPTGAKFKA